jgi:hypothetical protein
MANTPTGHEDMLADAEDGREAGFREIEVQGVGTFHARFPLPNAVAALGMATNAKISDEEKQNYLTKFVLNHLDEDEFYHLLWRMTTEDDIPKNALNRVARAIATAGTGRPIQPSSH